MKNKISELPTRIYIDGSNIRLACLECLGKKLDVCGLAEYFKIKYPYLEEMRYYEGISRDDIARYRAFSAYRSSGYTVCPLERIKYREPAEYRDVVCEKCGNVCTVRTKEEQMVMKSNVDVYLCADFSFDAAMTVGEKHFILVSCDGDYVEMVERVLRERPEIQVSVLATPYTKVNNRLSTRYKKLSNNGHFHLLNINEGPARSVFPLV